MTKNIAGQRQHSPRVGGVRHELRRIIGRELAELHFRGGIHGGIHKDHGVSERDGRSVFGRKLLADQRAHAGQSQRAYGFGDTWTNAVVAAQRVAVADDEEVGLACGCGAIHNDLFAVALLGLRWQAKRDTAFWRARDIRKRRRRYALLAQSKTYPRVTSFKTFPSAPINCTCNGIWPTACVEQLKHGS